MKRSGVEGAALKEAAAINASLLALGNVVKALAAASADGAGAADGAPPPHVPFRDSALTRALDGSVGGRSRTALLCCVSPSLDSRDETARALEFAARAMRVRAAPSINERTLVVDARALAAEVAADAAPEALRAARESEAALSLTTVGVLELEQRGGREV